MDETKLENRLTKLEEALDYIGEDIEEIKDTQNKIESLALSVNTLAVQVKRLVDDLCGMVVRVSDLEARSGRRWDGMVGTLITAIVAGLAGYALSRFF
jgi:hypothetical protein